MSRLNVNREGGDTVFYSKQAGVMVELFRVNAAGDTSFQGGLSVPQGKTVDVPGVVPVGAIIAWVPGTYADGSNGTYAQRTTIVSADSVAAANTYLSGRGWLVADGSILSDMSSPLYNAALPTRCLPNLTTERFLNGSIGCGGGQGGSNVMSDHLHTVSGTAAGQTYSASPTTVSQNTSTSTGPSSSAHRHFLSQKNAPSAAWQAFGGGGQPKEGAASAFDISQGVTHDDGIGSHSHSYAHTHTVPVDHTHAASALTATAGSGTNPSGLTIENRPNYLKCFYIMRVK